MLFCCRQVLTQRERDCMDSVQPFFQFLSTFDSERAVVAPATKAEANRTEKKRLEKNFSTKHYLCSCPWAISRQIMSRILVRRRSRNIPHRDFWLRKWWRWAVQTTNDNIGVASFFVSKKRSVYFEDCISLKKEFPHLISWNYAGHLLANKYLTIYYFITRLIHCIFVSMLVRRL